MSLTEELRQAIGYDPDEDGSVDDLIAYKDALEGIVDTLDVGFETVELVLAAARRRASELFEQASKYAVLGQPKTSEATMALYRPLRDAIDRLEVAWQAVTS